MNHQAYIQHILRAGGWCACVRCAGYRACAESAHAAGASQSIDVLRKAVFDAVLKEAGVAPVAI